MRYNDFKNIVNLLRESVKQQDNCKDILQPHIFEEHNELITALLKQIYNDYAVNYILNEWLCGNKSPIVFTSNEGTTVEIPMNTIRDLWKAMETYGELDKDKK